MRLPDDGVDDVSAMAGVEAACSAWARLRTGGSCSRLDSYGCQGLSVHVACLLLLDGCGGFKSVILPLHLAGP